MRFNKCSLLAFFVLWILPLAAGAQSLPFNQQVEVYRDEHGEVIVFAVRLEQPFLAEEFEKSNFLRLASLDRNSYLIYPRETKFHQKHAEFYGRLRGSGQAKLRLSYEIVSENLDGSRRVDLREAEIEVPIPGQETGPQSIYRRWAEEQNDYFAELLKYYPHETFFQYVLLQSAEKYGVTPPRLGKPRPTSTQIETDLYHVFSGGLSMQQSLQRHTLDAGAGVGDLNIHISDLAPPSLRSLPYEDLLRRKKEEEGIEPQVHELSKLVPEDQYFLHFNSMSTAEELLDLSALWGDNLLRLFTVHARKSHLERKFEDQLCLQRESMVRLFEDGVVTELAITGSDIFVAEGADLTIILRLSKRDVFDRAAERWLQQVKERFPGLVEREFNYRGHRVAARYTTDRMVSSFVVNKEEYSIYSNSHRAIRKVVDTLAGASPSLDQALDYRYLTTILQPSKDPQLGYLYASEAFLRRMFSPVLKISEKRRLQCLNNLVMLNNASLFYRLEHGSSPAALSDLTEGNFVNPSKLVCPHGGAYAIDAERDTCTCSLHNRLKYLTPNVELSSLRVSAVERQEYQRYKTRYESFWKKAFAPLAVRFTVNSRLRLELAIVPFANSEIYRDLHQWVDEPAELDTSRIAGTAVTSLIFVPGRDNIRTVLRDIPGVREAVEADPTLTDLNWLGDQVSLHLCDEDAILELDPTKLRSNLLGGVSIAQQLVVAAAISAMSLPLYLTVEVEDQDKARRLLRQLASTIFLEGGQLFGVPTRFDSYRLPDYEGHEIYVLSYQAYAFKVRLNVALVGRYLVAATRPQTLRDVIDASRAEKPGPTVKAHALLRVNHRALEQLEGDLQVYWNEKSRRACHHNIMSIHNLIKLYETAVADVDKLSDSKYGVTYFCPDGGTYDYDAASDQVACSLHGNRQHARQYPGLQKESSFSRFVDTIHEIVASLRFTDDALMATVEIERDQ